MRRAHEGKSPGDSFEILRYATPRQQQQKASTLSGTAIAMTVNVSAAARAEVRGAAPPMGSRAPGRGFEARGWAGGAGGDEGGASGDGGGDAGGTGGAAGGPQSKSRHHVSVHSYPEQEPA